MHETPPGADAATSDHGGSAATDGDAQPRSDRAAAPLGEVGLLVAAGATEVGGASMSLRDPHGLWAAILYWGLLATFSMAAAIPHRPPVPFGYQDQLRCDVPGVLRGTRRQDGRARDLLGSEGF